MFIIFFMGFILGIHIEYLHILIFLKTSAVRRNSLLSARVCHRKIS